MNFSKDYPTKPDDDRTVKPPKMTLLCATVAQLFIFSNAHGFSLQEKNLTSAICELKLIFKIPQKMQI